MIPTEMATFQRGWQTDTPAKNAEVPRKQPRLLDPHAGDALNGFLLNFLEYEWVFDYDRQEG